MATANEPLTYDQHQEVESHVTTYLKVFGALLVFTVLEYLYARLAQAHFLALVFGLMALAMTKAALVAIFFMHLKFEGRWVYLMLVPACLLALALVLGLYPDIGSRSNKLPSGPEEELTMTRLLRTPGPAPTGAGEPGIPAS